MGWQSSRKASSTSYWTCRIFFILCVAHDIFFLPLVLTLRFGTDIFFWETLMVVIFAKMLGKLSMDVSILIIHEKSLRAKSQHFFGERENQNDWAIGLNTPEAK